MSKEVLKENQTIITVSKGTILSKGPSPDSDFQIVLADQLELRIIGKSADGESLVVETAQPIKGMEGTFFLGCTS